MTARQQTAKPVAKRLARPGAVKALTTNASKSTGTKIAMPSLKREGGTDGFVYWFKLNFADKIHYIRTGLPAKRVGELSFYMGLPKEALMDSLGLSRATINRKVQREQPLSPEESERVMGMQVLIGQVQAMIDPENAPDFDAAKWLAHWLTTPLPALGGATPASYMDTVEGQKYIGNLLEMVQSGAYA